MRHLNPLRALAVVAPRGASGKPERNPPNK
jgi:hypothetical protein